MVTEPITDAKDSPFLRIGVAVLFLVVASMAIVYASHEFSKRQASKQEYEASLKKQETADEPESSTETESRPAKEK